MDMETIDQIREEFSRDEFARICLGATIDSYDFDAGVATVSMNVDERHHNAQGFVMGGVFFALADFALAIAGNVNQPPSSSVASSVQFMRRAKSDHLIATARPDKLGRNLAFFTVDVTDDCGTHIMRMTATLARTNH